MIRRTALAVAALTLLALPAHAATERKKGGGLSYTQFPTLTATIVRASGGRGVMSVEAGIDVPDPALKARGDLLVPRLLDAYTRFLTAYAASVPVGTPPDPDRIEAAFQRATDQVIGKPGARVLLGTVLVN